MCYLELRARGPRAARMYILLCITLADSYSWFTIEMTESKRWLRSMKSIGNVVHYNTKLIGYLFIEQSTTCILRIKTVSQLELGLRAESNYIQTCPTWVSNVNVKGETNPRGHRYQGPRRQRALILDLGTQSNVIADCFTATHQLS